LTGGIASGKSTVARELVTLGVPVVDADEVAREVVTIGSEGLAAVVAELGPDVLAADGSLDRKRVAAQVFADAGARARLNAVLHPRIAARSMERLRELSEAGAPYVVYEAALLVENGIHRMLAALVVVAVSRDSQLARLMERDGLTRADAESRVDSQLPLAEKVTVADYVIDNDGDLARTRAQVRETHLALCARFGRSTVAGAVREVGGIDDDQ
jgi:dephospho-CoA kinase